MVAAWIRAETGVGPSIASGSQTWSGNWALLPTAPQKISRAMRRSATRGDRAPNFAKTSCMLSVPSWVQMAMIPRAKPMSPTRLTRKAFLAASAADAARVPEADQQVAAQAHQLPAGEDEQEVVRQDQQQHREHEQVQVGEEAPLAGVVGHVADRVDVDEHADRRDHDQQAGRQRVDVEAHVGVEAGGRDPGPERDAEAARRSRGCASGRRRRRPSPRPRRPPRPRRRSGATRGPCCRPSSPVTAKPASGSSGMSGIRKFIADAHWLIESYSSTSGVLRLR